MTAPRRQLGPTPLAIIEAAERLFGEYGVERVSIRQIGLAANVLNKSAISYHFGDRADLVRAIWAHRLPVLDRMRRAMLDEYAGIGQTRDPHAIIRALLVPSYQLVDRDGHRRYAAFLRSVLRWPPGLALRAQEMAASPASRDALELLYAQSGVPRAILIYRLGYATGAFLDMIVDRDREIHQHQVFGDPAAFLREGIAMVVAHCLRPVAD